MTHVEIFRQAAAEACGMTVEQLLSRDVTRRASNARFIVTALTRQLLPWSSKKDIAVAMGRTDPTTATYALTKAEDLALNCEQFRQCAASAAKIAARLMKR